jgi:hypothetical protein
MIKKNDQTKFDEGNREEVMLIILLIIDEMLFEVQRGSVIVAICK